MKLNPITRIKSTEKMCKIVCEGSRNEVKIERDSGNRCYIRFGKLTMEVIGLWPILNGPLKL